MRDRTSGWALLSVVGAARDLVGDLVDGVLDCVLGLIDAAFALERLVVGQHSGRFLYTTCHFVHVLIGHLRAVLLGIRRCRESGYASDIRRSAVGPRR